MEAEVMAAMNLVPFGEMAEVQSDEGRKLKQKEYLQEGTLPVVDQGATLVGGYTDDLQLKYGGPLPVLVFGDHTRSFKLIDFAFAVGADGVKLFTAREGVDPHYLYYMLLAIELPNRGYSRHFQFLKKAQLPLAPLPEQRRIVSAIEMQLGRLDAAVARLHAAKAKLKRYKQAVLKAAFTDEDWPIVSIGDVYEVFVGSTPSRAKPQFWNGTVPWVSSGEVAFCEIHETRERIATEALGNSEKRLHPAGTVMLAMIGEGKTRGQAAILRIPAAHNQNTAAIRMPDDLHSPEYLYYYFLYEYENTRRVGSGNNQMALNKSRIQDIELPLPDAEEQMRTALAIRDRFEVLAETETTLDAQLEQSTRLRQAVLKRAFEGRLV